MNENGVRLIIAVAKKMPENASLFQPTWYALPCYSNLRFHLTGWEQSKTKPQFDYIIRLAQILEVSIDHLLLGEEGQKGQSAVGRKSDSAFRHSSQ